MADEVETIEVRLKYSPSGAMGRINRNDFDPEKHALPEEPSPTAPTPPPPATETPPAVAESTEPSSSPRRMR